MASKEETEEILELDNEICTQKDSNDGPSTSGKLKLPNETADNMKDLKPYDFNSADEVRQTMKAVLDGKESNFEEIDEDCVPVNFGDEELQRNKLHLHIMSKVTGTDESNRTDKDMLETNVWLTRTNKTRKFRKRAGRPPKAGPSKKIMKPRLSTFYFGKLSNVVFLNRKSSTH